MAGEGNAPISFAAAIAKENNTSAPLRVVQIDGQVLLKIMKHCTDCAPTLVTGQLLGLDIGQTLEVTDCFPFPARGFDYDEAGDGASYQIDMMKCLREVNVDNNTVGWYQSTVVGSFQTTELIETFVSYHETIRRCVCIVYDTTSSGINAFKAIRLREAFVKAFKDQALTAEKLAKASISFKDVFEEIPIKVHNSPLVRALLAEIEPPSTSAGTATAKDEDMLSLKFTPYLARNLEFLNDCLDDMMTEQQKITNHARAVQRQQREYMHWLNKRRQENIARRAAGEDPLPEDASQFKQQPDLSQLDNYLIANQIDSYCDQVDAFSGLALQKLNVMQALQHATRLLAYLLVRYYHCHCKPAIKHVSITWQNKEHHHHVHPNLPKVSTHDTGQTASITLLTAILAPILPQIGGLLCSIVHHAAITLRRPDVPAALMATLLHPTASSKRPSSLLPTLTTAVLKANRHPEAIASTLDAVTRRDDVDVERLVDAVTPALVQCLGNARTAAHVATVSMHLLQLDNEDALTAMACALLDAEHFHAAGILLYAACTLPKGDLLLSTLTVQLLNAQRAWHAARAVAMAAVVAPPGQSHPGARSLMAEGMASAAVAAVEAGHAHTLARDIAPVLCGSTQGRQLASALVGVLDRRGQQRVLGVLCVHMLTSSGQVMQDVGLQLLHDGFTSAAAHTVMRATQTPGNAPDVLCDIAATMLMVATQQGFHMQLLEVSDTLCSHRSMQPLLRAIVLQAHAQGGMSALVSVAAEGLRSTPHTLQVLAGVLIRDPACQPTMAALTGQLTREPKNMSRVVKLASTLLQRAPLDHTEQQLAALAHVLVLDRHIELLRQVTLRALAAKQGALLVSLGITAMEHGHQVIIWALTFDLVYYGNEQDVAALGAQVAIAGAPDALIDALVRPLIDLVAAGRQHTLAEVTKLMVDRYRCAWFVERVAERLLKDGHGDAARALTPHVAAVAGVGPLAKIGARLAGHPKALFRLAAT